MKTADVTSQFIKLQRARQRFESRQRFFARCISDISSDFHKQYGPFERDWQATHDACVLFAEELAEYLCTRDVVAIECQVLLGAIADAPTKYKLAKSQKRFQTLLNAWRLSDQEILAEFDENIADVRSAYRMLAVKEECGY